MFIYNHKAVTLKNIDKFVFDTYEMMSVNLLKLNNDSSITFRLLNSIAFEMNSYYMDIPYGLNISSVDLDLMVIDRVNRYNYTKLHEIKFDPYSYNYTMDKDITGYSYYTKQQYILKLANVYSDFTRHSLPCDFFILDNAAIINKYTLSLTPGVDNKTSPVPFKVSNSQITVHVTTDLHASAVEFDGLPTVTIFGVDIEGKEVSEKLAIANIPIAYSKNCYIYIYNIVLSGTSESCVIDLYTYKKKLFGNWNYQWRERPDMYQLYVGSTIDMANKTLVFGEIISLLGDTVTRELDPVAIVPIDIPESYIILDYYIDDTNELIYLIAQDTVNITNSQRLLCLPYILPYRYDLQGKLRKTNNQHVKVLYENNILNQEFIVTTDPVLTINGIEECEISLRYVIKDSYNKVSLQPNFQYSKTDVIEYNQSNYICIEPHRYTIRNGMRLQSGIIYSAGDAIQYAGEMYICTSIHTALSDYTTELATYWIKYFDTYWTKELVRVRKVYALDMLRQRLETNQTPISYEQLFALDDAVIVNIQCYGVGDPSEVEVLLQNAKLKPCADVSIYDLFARALSAEPDISSRKILPKVNIEDEELFNTVMAYNTPSSNTYSDFNIYTLANITSTNYISVDGKSLVPVFDTFAVDNANTEIITSDTITSILDSEQSTIWITLPDNISSLTSLDLTVETINARYYQYSLDGDFYSGDIDIVKPISISNLADGSHILSIKGKLLATGNYTDPVYYMWYADVEPPTAINVSLPEGTYDSDSDVQVKLSAIDVGSNDDCTIYYTLNGSDVIVSGNVDHSNYNLYTYLRPLTLTATTTIKAAAIDQNGNTSGQYSFTYTINDGGFAFDVRVNNTSITEDAYVSNKNAIIEILSLAPLVTNIEYSTERYPSTWVAYTGPFMLSDVDNILWVRDGDSVNTPIIKRYIYVQQPSTYAFNDFIVTSSSNILHNTTVDSSGSVTKYNMNTGMQSNTLCTTNRVSYLEQFGTYTTINPYTQYIDSSNIINSLLKEIYDANFFISNLSKNNQFGSYINDVVLSSQASTLDELNILLIDKPVGYYIIWYDVALGGIYNKGYSGLEQLATLGDIENTTLYITDGTYKNHIAYGNKETSIYKLNKAFNLGVNTAVIHLSPISSIETSFICVIAPSSLGSIALKTIITLSNSIVPYSSLARISDNSFTYTSIAAYTFPFPSLEDSYSNMYLVNTLNDITTSIKRHPYKSATNISKMDGSSSIIWIEDMILVTGKIINDEIVDISSVAGITGAYLDTCAYDGYFYCLHSSGKIVKVDTTGDIVTWISIGTTPKTIGRIKVVNNSLWYLFHNANEIGAIKQERVF